MRSRILSAAVAAALVLPALAHADDEPSRFRLSGFGTLGAVRSDNENAEFVTSPLQPRGSHGNWDFGTDSLLAGQVDFQATKSLSFVGQLVANRSAEDNYTPHVEWAFVRYAFRANVVARGGIMAIPAFLVSDSRLVGFANPWVRPPAALYSQLPTTSIRGVDLVYRTTVGDASVSVQPYYGNAPVKVPDGSGGTVTGTNDHMTGINLSAELGGWTGRLGYLHTKSTTPAPQLEQLFGAMRAIDPFVPGAAAYASELEAVNKDLSFVSAGVAYEGANILFQAEIAKRKLDFFAPDTTSGYATLGYRFGNVLPFVTYSGTRVDKLTKNTLIPTTGPFAPIGLGLENLLARQNTAQNTVSLGARWQFAKNFDAKLQWDHVNLPSGAAGNFNLLNPEFYGSRVNVYSVAVDFVF